MPRKETPGGPADRARIEHMHSAARAALRFVENRDRKELDTDDMLRRALVNAIQEIGEAAARVSDIGRTRIPELPWGQIVAMRHILVHVYWGVDLDQLWKVVVEDIPLLLNSIDNALNNWPDTE